MGWYSHSKDLYNSLYASGGYYPQNAKFAWNSVIRNIKFNKALDVGCGPGVAIKDMLDIGHGNITGIDIASELTHTWNKLGISDRCVVAPAHKIPFADNEFDFVLCADCLEHIPVEGIDESFREMYRVCSGKAYFLISLVLERTYKEGKEPLHCTLKQPEWWKSKIEKNGFRVVYDKTVKDAIMAVVAEANKNYMEGE